MVHLGPIALAAAELPIAGGQVFASADLAVAFCLAMVSDRLLVQRTLRHATGAVAVQCFLIDGPEDFRQWCDVDPTRFDDPGLFDRVRRYGDEAFAARR